ncbi:hypothetical protein BTL55_14310 [Bordetella trematum]|nr:hypothetical protein BTL55_14310 [Bordetella trematum]
MADEPAYEAEAPPPGVVEPSPGVVSGVLGAGDGVGAASGCGAGSGVGAGVVGAVLGLVGAGLSAGGAADSSLLQAASATAMTEAAIRVLLIMSRLLVVKTRRPRWQAGKTSTQATRIDSLLA